MKRLFTSESVTEGHPDKLCDYISDSILDSYLAKDKNARVACETVAGKGEIFITGEITSTANVDIEQVVRDTIKEVGYADSEYDIDYRTCKIYINLSKQSPDIALGVDKSLEDKEGKDVESEGAGDQGLMFGYACDETEELMPLPISLAHKLSKRLTEVRRENIIDYLRPDGKTQVTVEYDGEKPVRVDTIVVSTQHDEFITAKGITQEEADLAMQKKIAEDVKSILIPRVKAQYPAHVQALFNDDIIYHVNPTGKFVIGGPHGDTGLTGRKIIVDTYGGKGAHGGGAFSGKDPSKVDRSAAYAARHIAKNLVAAGVADEMLVQVSYAIGVAKPMNIFVNTFGRANVKMTDGEIAEKIWNLFDMRPKAIEERLKLRNPIYLETASYGHMGRKPQVVTKTFTSRYNPEPTVCEVELFTWEKLDYVDKVKEAFGL